MIQLLQLHDVFLHVHRHTFLHNCRAVIDVSALAATRVGVLRNRISNAQDDFP